MTVAQAPVISEEEQATRPFAYLQDGKRLVEVLWVENKVATVHDCADPDEASTFTITQAEITKWQQVTPDG